MPGGNGLVLANRLREVLLTIPIIFMSGNAEAHDEVTARGFVCLQKPFDITAIDAVLQEVLRGVPRQPADRTPPYTNQFQKTVS
jgi:DNA-binding response OmpR family regulator